MAVNFHSKAATRINRHWRLASLGCLLATIIWFAITDDPRISAWNSRSVWTEWIPEVERIGLEAFLAETTARLEASGSIGHQEFVVPADFGEGTKANFTSSLFPRVTLGHAFQPIPLPRSDIMTRPWDPPTSDMTGDTFNPAILKMPRGIAPGWEYIVVARGPRVQRKDIWIEASWRNAEEHGLVAFPATLTPEGFIPSPVSPAKFLPIESGMNNTACGAWAFPFGPEDPRLYWTDQGRPVMTLSMNAQAGERCRGVWLLEDLRNVWDELGIAMRGIDKGLAVPYVRKHDREGQGITELLFDSMRDTEKNWMFFYPGATPDRSQNLPSFHHNLAPARTLRPPLAPLQDYKAAMTYTLTPSTSNPNCISDTLRAEVPYANEIHHATPLYRFTLCERRDPGCVPGVENTVLMAVGQVKVRYRDGQRYRRFMVLWNVTEPFEYVAVGPLVTWYDTPDAQIVYAMSLIFTPTAPTSRHAARIDEARERDLGPMHGFLDDEAFVSLGLRDNEMGTVRMPARELLYGMTVC